MALINTQNSTLAAKAPVQISIQNSTPAQAVMYTVPTGRKFVGHITNSYQSGGCYINSMQLSCYYGNATAVAAAWSLNQITLLGGTVVKEGATANSTSILGVESDV